MPLEFLEIVYFLLCYITVVVCFIKQRFKLGREVRVSEGSSRFDYLLVSWLEIVSDTSEFRLSKWNLIRGEYRKLVWRFFIYSWGRSKRWFLGHSEGWLFFYFFRGIGHFGSSYWVIFKFDYVVFCWLEIKGLLPLSRGRAQKLPFLRSRGNRNYRVETQWPWTDNNRIFSWGITSLFICRWYIRLLDCHFTPNILLPISMLNYYLLSSINLFDLHFPLSSQRCLVSRSCYLSNLVILQRVLYLIKIGLFDLLISLFLWCHLKWVLLL